MNPLIYSTIIKIEEKLVHYYNKINKNSPQDGRQMVEAKFNPYKIISHYYNNRFALQYAHIHNL